MKITPILWTSRQTKSGLYPVKIRTTEMVNGKPNTHYYPLGINIPKNDWDEDKKEVKSTNLNMQEYNLKIMEKVLEYNTNSFHGDAILHGDKLSFYRWYEEYLKIKILDMREANYQREARPLTQLKNFTSKLMINQIDIPFIMRFESHLLNEKNLHTNYVAAIFQIIGRVIKFVIGGGAMQYHKNPLLNYKFKTATKKKERLTHVQIEKFAGAPLKKNRHIIERDWFLISFYCGIRFSDRCVLRPENFLNGRLRYQMLKTGTIVDIPIPPKALPLLKKYHFTYTDKVRALHEINHVFSLNKKKDLRMKLDFTSQQIKKVQRIARTGLRAACKVAGVPVINLHTSRHSLADFSLLKGLSPAQIQAQLGHKDLQTTVIYLGNISQEVSDAGSQKLWA